MCTRHLAQLAALLLISRLFVFKFPNNCFQRIHFCIDCIEFKIYLGNEIQKVIGIKFDGFIAVLQMEFVLNPIDSHTNIVEYLLKT